MLATASPVLYSESRLLSWKTSSSISAIKDVPHPPVISNDYFSIIFPSDKKILQQFLNTKSAAYAWQLSISNDGAFIVIVKSNNLELRSSKNNFANINFQSQIYKDLYPQFRTVSWSSLSNYFAVSFSNGIINLWDLQGVKLTFNTNCSKSNDFDVIIKVNIIEVSKVRIKLYVFTLNGMIFFYDIENFRKSTNLQGNIKFIATPILCCESSNDGNLIVLGTYNQIRNKCETDAFQSGIIICRLIDEDPFLIPNMNKGNSSSVSKSWFSYFSKMKASDGIFMLRLSKDNMKLAALHISGKLSIWNFPSLSLCFVWRNVTNILNPFLTIENRKNKVFPRSFNDYSIEHFCWWDSKYIAVALRNGSTLILANDTSVKLNDCNINLQPFPQIEESTDKTFFALNCLCTSSKNVEQKSVQVVEKSLWKVLKVVINYLLADPQTKAFSGNYHPCSQNYTLSGFQLTTPEELFTIRIHNKEYAEALLLATQYNLDSDIVFQKQWRDSRKSIDDIENILIKIKKQNWILNECLTEIPDNIESMKLLLKLGFYLTDIDKIQNVFINDIDLDVSVIDSIGNNFRNIKVEKNIIDTLNIHEFNLIQLEILRIRMKLLNYYDKLTVYEQILDISKDIFDSKMFNKLKNLSSFEIAIKFARQNDIVGLRMLLKFYHNSLIRHILTILSNIPECIEPKTYQDLFENFKYLSSTKETVLIKDLDWCESDCFAHIYNKESILDESEYSYYNDNPDHKQFVLNSNSNYDGIIDNWCHMRIRTIESETFNTSYAFEMLQIFKKLNIHIDKNLEFNLRFLYDGLYYCQMPNSFISLSEFELLSDFEKANLLMYKANSDRFLINFNHFIMPMLEDIYILSSQRSFEFFQEYLTHLGKRNIICTRKLLEDKECIEKILKIIKFRDIVKFYLTILFEDDVILNINECASLTKLLNELILKEVSESQVEYICEFKQLQDIENYIHVLRILEKYELKKSIKFIHENRMNGELVENLITNMIFHYFKNKKNITKSMIKSVFTEIQLSLSLVFKSVHPTLIYKNLLKSMLESGDYKKITIACEFMTLSTKILLLDNVEYHEKLVDFPDSVQCILMASRNYINSSTSSKDENMLLAKFCLELIENPTDDIKIEKEIISCSEFLDKWKCSIVPIELRHIENKFELLKTCLDKNKNLYKEMEEIINAGTYLYKDKMSNKKFKEGEALRLVARKAYINNDREILEIAMSSLLHRNHKPCWEECIMTLKFNCYPEEKKNILRKYAIAHCPDTKLMEIMKFVNGIELSVPTQLESEFNIVDYSSTSSTISSSLIKQPIKLFSSGLIDLSSRVNLKSLIGKSSDTLVKLTSSVPKFKFQKTQDVFYKNDNKSLKEMSFDLIYHHNGRFAIEYADDTLISDIGKMLTMSSYATNDNIQNRDEMHMKILQLNLYQDTIMAIIHAMLISDINQIFALRHDIPANTYTKTLIYSMIGLNLILKYQHSFPLLNTISINKIETILTPLMSEMHENDLSVFKSISQELKDYILLDKINENFPTICKIKFFSSVDYRKEIIFQLSEFSENDVLLDYAVILANRYNIDRYTVHWNYFISFINKCSLSDNDFTQKYNLFNKKIDIITFIESSPSLACDIEKILSSDSKVNEFKIILKIIPDKCNFLLFNKSPSDHRKWIKVFESIFQETNKCNYLDLCTNEKTKIIACLKLIINSENIKVCSQLLNEFQLSEEFSKVKNDLSSVLANQTLWTNLSENTSWENNLDFLSRFDKSLENFSIYDSDLCKDFIFNILFEKTEKHINSQLKINMIKHAGEYIDNIVNDQKHSEIEIGKWLKVSLEISIWLDHMENTVQNVVDKLNQLSSLSKDIVTIAEYMPPDNYWKCLLTEMLLQGVSYQDLFTLTWDLSVDSEIIENSIFFHISHIFSSKYLPLEGILEKVSQILEELDDYLDFENVVRILERILNEVDLRDEIHQILLNEYITRIRKNKSKTNFPVGQHILKIMKGWGLPVNEKVKFQKNNIHIIDSLIQDCESPEKMKSIPKVIELIELVEEDNNLWQCWIKACVIKGPEFCSYIYEQFETMKNNKLYTTRIEKLSKDAIQSLSAFNAAEAISLLILMNPVAATDQVQIILLALKSDPAEFTNTMKNINIKALQIIVDGKLIPLYAKTILYHRLVNFITKENDDPNIVQEVLEQLKSKGFLDEATWLTSSSSHLNPAMKTIEMVSGFWKRFSSGSNN